MIKKVFFFLGTEAELIKIFPLILECKDKFGIHIISTGQNNLNKSRIINEFDEITIDLELSLEENIKKNAMGLFIWYITTTNSALSKIRNYYRQTELKGEYLIVHGDTVSTLMGAVIGKKLGMTTCHVEAGLRSHNYFNPFPEEIDRILTSKRAYIHFAPGQVPCNNLKNSKGEVVNTEYNTIIDSLNYSLNIPCRDKIVNDLISNQKYFVFVMHRQENLMNKKFVKNILQRIQRISLKLHCVIILHKTTENTLINLRILEELKRNTNITLLQRLNYFDFMKLLNSSEFVITDGGSNQEELFYMGKPCLIIRKNTERNEGIGFNAILFDGNLNMLDNFSDNYKSYKSESLIANISPSKMICDYLYNRKPM